MKNWHESLDHPVKYGAIVKSVADITKEILNRFRSCLLTKFQGDDTLISFQAHARVGRVRPDAWDSPEQSND